MYKNILKDTLNVCGYCFVDEDALEVRVSIPKYFLDSLVVDISTDGSNDEITIYHKDIPKLIKVLEAAYTHTVETHKD